jgi:hypothetical protein
LRNLKRDEEKIGSLAKANLLDLDLEFWERLAEKGNSPYGFFRTSIATAASSPNDTPIVKTAVLAYILKCQLAWKVKITMIKTAPELADSTIS